MTGSKGFLLRTFILALLGTLVSLVGGAETEPLGAAGSIASPEHPFGFRGDGSGRFPGATPPINWSPEKNVRWSAAVGSGYSSPILAGDCVIVTSEPDLLICLNRADGKERWRVRTTPQDVSDDAGRNAAAANQPPKNGSGFAAATPITDGRNIYAVFANGIVRAIGIDGKPGWTTCVTAPPCTGYGRAASPILVGGRLIVHMTGLYAFDPQTGKQLWANDDAKSTYATPVASKIGADEIIVTPSGDVLRAADGKSMTSAIGMTQQASPIVGPDGTIYFPSGPISAVRLAPDFKDTEIWSGPISGDTFSSPLLVENNLFIVNSDGQLFAFDIHAMGSADPVINGRALVAPTKGSPAVFSSVSLAGKYLFLHSNRGETIVLEANREAKQVAKNQLPSGSGASPVFCGKEIYIRDGEKLLCIRW